MNLCRLGGKEESLKGVGEKFCLTRLVFFLGLWKAKIPILFVYGEHVLAAMPQIH